MDWVKSLYTQRSRWLGPSGILDHHRARAASIGRLCGEGLKRILELGAGAGGAAAALADLGHHVTAVELRPLRATYARELAATPRAGTVEVIQGDFYTATIAGLFDIVAYWDGFGVGSDADQRRLLRRVAEEWLRADGCMLLDVYNPFPWARLAGQTQRHDEINAVQQRDFDMVGCRFIDRWCQLTTSPRPWRKASATTRQPISPSWSRGPDWPSSAWKSTVPTCPLDRTSDILLICSVMGSVTSPCSFPKVQKAEFRARGCFPARTGAVAW